MLGPSGFFCFTHLAPQKRGVSLRYAFAYKPPGPIQRGALEQLMADLCRGPFIPDAVVVLGLLEEPGKELYLALQAGSAKLAQQRLQGRIPLIFATYSLRNGLVKSDLLDPHFKKNNADYTIDISVGIKQWMESGLRSVFEPAKVVLQAPSGYAYQKPSGARSDFFLKPDLGLTSSANVGFVALTLFNKIYAGNTKKFDELHTVFVDTMAIAPVAYALRELLGLCGYDKAFIIESFHSYGGFDAIKRPLARTSLCLISASSSMSLHEQWRAQKRVNHDEVVTLLTCKSAGKLADEALLSIDRPGPDSAGGPVQLSIRIKGETFLPEQELAKKVLLSDKIHRSDGDVSMFCSLAGLGVFDIYRRPPKSQAKVRALFVDGHRLLQREHFLNWLSEQLFHATKAATRSIVYQDDPPSRRLAELVKEFCEVRLALSELNLFSSDALPEVQLKPQDGVIVCAAVVGKGSQLLEISRALRDKHQGPRLYLVGYQVTETRSELGALKANLTHSKSLPYEFARYGGAAIGTQLLESFDHEIRTYYPPSANRTGLPGLMGRRASLLGSTHPLAQLVFNPHGAGVDKTMHLRAGFAYWPGGYAAQPCHPEVLATVAVLLQRAREDDKLPEERRLASGSYRHVVLDPENFTRFNDGVLQAAVLRSAFPSELDYRADYAASDFMKAVILRALARSTQEAGEAVLEFLLALALRRLQLVETHLDEILKSALDGTGRPLTLQRAISFLLSPSNSTLKRRQKLPF